AGRRLEPCELVDNRGVSKNLGPQACIGTHVSCWRPGKATPRNKRFKWGTVDAYPVMAGEGRPSTTFLRANGEVVDGRLSPAMTGWQPWSPSNDSFVSRRRLTI